MTKEELSEEETKLERLAEEIRKALASFGLEIKWSPVYQNIVIASEHAEVLL